jgi:hypothetical protein
VWLAILNQIPMLRKTAPNPQGTISVVMTGTTVVVAEEKDSADKLRLVYPKTITT